MKYTDVATLVNGHTTATVNGERLVFTPEQWLEIERGECEHIKHIQRSHAEHSHLTWCGKPAAGFNFIGVDHAAENGKNEGRLVACGDCVAEVLRSLKHGHG